MAEENLKTVETVDTRPFRKLVMTIGELPTSYIESMTYYELLTWFVNYLETVIIPTVNNNGEALEELQQKYIELKADTEQEIDDFENEMTTAFNTLKDFVDNYFDNIDVQEEINNKLDQMAEDGQLTQLIAQFLSLNAVMSFPNVAAMKLAENLVNGSTCETYGFYNVNDGGGAKYYIRTVTNDDVVDEKTIIELYDDYLIAELIKEDTMTVKQFGAKGDGLTDDTLAIQTALNYCGTVEFPTGTFMVNAETSILPNNDNTLILDNDCILKAITNSNANYAIIKIQNKNNITITGGKLLGDKDTHTGSTGEWGNCIELRNANNITLKNITLTKGWGDGLYINTVDHLYTENLYIKENRRNGISVISATNYTSLNDTIEDTGGTLPEAGIDFEPNLETDVFKNIKVINMTSRRNTNFGMIFALTNLTATSDPIDIEITNFKDEASMDGMRLTKTANARGLITLNSPSLINNPENSVQLRNFTWGENFKLIINDLYVRRDAGTVSGTNSDYSPIAVYGSQTPIGGVVIKNSRIYQDALIPNGVVDMYFRAAKDIEIIEPLYGSGSKRPTITLIEGNFKIYDPLHIYGLDSSYASGEIGGSDGRTRSIKGAGAGTDTTVTISNSAPIGYTCEFINASTKVYSIKLPDGYYCRAFGNTTGATLNLASGASIKLEVGANNTVIATGQVGTITVA